MSIKTMINAALATPDDGVDAPNGFRTGSLPSRIKELSVGGIASALNVPDNGESIHTLMEFGVDDREGLRNTIASAVARAKKHRPGHEYSVEVFYVIAPSGRVVILGLITRTK